MANAQPPPAVQTLSRLLDPITSTSSQTVFIIPKNGSAKLKSDVMLHVGCTVTIQAANPPNHPTYDKTLGGYALLQEIQLLDGQGRSLYHLKNAARFAALTLLRSPVSYNFDIGHDRELTQRQPRFEGQTWNPANGTSAQNGGRLQNINPADYPTDNAQTTARVALNLSGLCSLLQNEIPLSALGELRVVITWQTNVAMMFSPSAVTSNPVIVQPQLTYSLLTNGQIEAPDMSLQLMYEEPLAQSNFLPNVAGTVSLPMGGSGQRATRFAAMMVANSAGAVVASPVAINDTVLIRLNNKPLYPQPLKWGSAWLESDRAFGPLSLPLNCWFANAQNNISNGVSVTDTQTIYGFSLKQLMSEPGSLVNCTVLDQSGLYFEVNRAAGAAMNVFGYLFVPRVLTIKGGEVQSLI